MQLFKKTNIRFMEIRGAAYLVSASLILIGLLSIATRGVSFGIDFLGGTELVVSFSQPVAISDVRSALTKGGLERAEIKTYGADSDVLIRTTEQGEGTVVGDHIKAALKQGMTGASFQVLKEDKIGPKVGKELREDAVLAVFWSLIVILVYLAFRFKFIYGLGAVLALFHDVLVTLGILSLVNGIIPGLNLEITQEVIAAFLTLVGVSVNDTVVVFDRIRENERLYRSMNLKDVMTRSLNETLSRTVITSGTIFIVLIVLLLLGGEVNRGFAFTMTIGIITGTYSSIYVASAIVLDWPRRRAKA